MHGEISLQSSLGNGTTATFSIPFNKPQYHNGAATIMDAGNLPDRLQSEMSVSCNSSEYEQFVETPPAQSPSDPYRMRRKPSSISMTPPVPTELELSPEERAKTKILVVEDK
jgi:hypothetical protein